MNWNEFNNAFQTEQQCLAYIAKLKVIKCIRCFSFNLNTSDLKRMRCLKCNQTFSILTGTIFSRSQTSLTSWFYLIFRWINTKHGIPSTDVAKELGVTLKTAWRMTHKIRTRIAKQKPQFIVEGTVQIDEMYLSHMGFKKQGRSLVNKTLIVGVYQKTTNNLIVKVLKNAKSKNLNTYNKVDAKKPICDKTLLKEVFIFMAKCYSQKEKLEMLKKAKGLGCTTASKILNIDETTVRRWRKEVRLLGEEGLIPGKGIQSIGKRQGRPKTLDFNEMTKQELIEYIEVMNDIKKYLEKSTKKQKYFVIFSLKKKYQISYLCWLLNVSKSGYYKWIKNGMNEFNKWNKFLANIIKNIFYEFKEIYGYQMITLWINKIYNLKLKFHIVYRYMRNMNLKSKVRIKKFDYKSKSGNLRYDNLLNRDFSTTDLNQKLGTDITYLLTNGKTYYLSIIKDFHNNEILDFKISSNLDMSFVVKNIIQAWVNSQKPNSWILQSDQGFHYTNPSYKTLCDELKIKISMSRRGNSCDNGATESWFGTMKTEFLYQIPRKNRTIEWIKENLPKYIYFYNNHRPQIKLKGMSPIEYRLTHPKTNIKFISSNSNLIKSTL